jgi:AraC family ethanolamine operon transcriptional activator
MMETVSAPLLAPEIFEFDDVDAFRSRVRNVELDVTPLVRKISAAQIILNLPGCCINLTRGFPRILDARLAKDCTAVGFSMDDGIPVRFNGVERDQSAIVIGSGGAAFSVVAKSARESASIVFMPEVLDRGWPEAYPNFKIFETSPAAHQRLRELARQIMSVSRSGISADAAAAIKESLLAAIDAAFADVVPARWVANANSARQFKIFQDIRAALSASVANPIYSEDLAQQVGVSVRTMHDAVLRYTGMSLHRYLRLRRLWLVRQRLLTGAQSVKACALAFGFWHMGDFSRSYRSQFGEAPSETLARSR